MGQALIRFRALAAPSGGGWAGITYPRATQSSGITFWGYDDGPTGDIVVRAYDDATQTASAPAVLHHALSGIFGSPGDSHAAPALHVRTSDQRILVFYCTQGDTHMRKVLSTNPLDITDFSSEALLSLSATNYLYPCVAQLSAESGRIYLHFKDFPTGTTYLRQSHSDDGGSTWSSSDRLYQSINGFFAFGTNSVDRVDFVVTDPAPSVGSPNSLYHFYMQGGDFYLTDGTLIGATAPFGPSDLTLIYDGGGAAFPYGIVYTADGRPVVACSEYGPTNRYFELRWSGSTWDRHDVATAVAVLPGDQAPGMAHDERDANRIVYGKTVGSAIEMFEARSGDDGATWAARRLGISYASDVVFLPTMVTKAVESPGMIWSRGTYTDDYHFSMGTDGID